MKPNIPKLFVRMLGFLFTERLRQRYRSTQPTNFPLVRAAPSTLSLYLNDRLSIKVDIVRCFIEVFPAAVATNSDVAVLVLVEMMLIVGAGIVGSRGKFWCWDD